MKHEPRVNAGDLERATSAIRASAAAVTPSTRSIEAMLEMLGARQRDGRPQRQVMATGKGGLSLTEEALMKKWRFHDAFRPLSFESLERRRLLAAVSAYQDDGSAERRAWPDSLFLPVIHVRGDRPQRRWDSHVEPHTNDALVSDSADVLAPGRFAALSSSDVFGSELIFAA